MNAPRIAPLDPPYDPDIAAALAKWDAAGIQDRAAETVSHPGAQSGDQFPPARAGPFLIGDIWIVEMVRRHARGRSHFRFAIYAWIRS